MEQDFVVLFSFEDGAAEEEVVEDDSCREDVADGFALSSHISDVDDFWSYEARSAASDKEILLLICIGSQPEVANSCFPHFFLLEHDVFRLQVSMNYPVLG